MPGIALSDRQLLALARKFALPETAAWALRGETLCLRFANVRGRLERCGHASLACVADHLLRRLGDRHGRACPGGLVAFLFISPPRG
jgi:predicted PhzF superfamily epimerase YddE/YHI9